MALNNENNYEYQAEAIEVIRRGDCKNIFISGATLCGKSTCLHIAGKTDCDGASLIFFPSLSLIDSTEEKLNSEGIRTVAITSDTLYRDRNVIFDEMDDDGDETTIKFLLVTAEMFDHGDQYTVKRIKKLIKAGIISRIFIDDEVNFEGFRENAGVYKTLRREYPDVPWVFTTTVPSEVDAMRIYFEIDDHMIFRAPEAARLDITYEVKKCPRFNSEDLTMKIIDDVHELIGKSQKSGLIFTEYDDECVSIANALTISGIKAEAFYSKREDRLEVQKRWKQKEFPVLVANTESFRSAFVELPLRFIFNATPSKSVKKYYQESGRGTDIIARVYYRPGWSVDAQMKSYLEYAGCRHLYIARTLGHEEGSRCRTKCDNCNNQQHSPAKKLRTM